MTASHGVGTYGNAIGTVTPADHKLGNAASFAKATSSLAIRPGLMWGGADNIVTGTSGMTYNVAAFTAVLSRGGTSGAIPIANDGVLNVATTAAPGSNSRYDVVYLWQREFSIDGTDSNPVIGVLQGTIAASPTVPALTSFPGAIALANILVPAGVTATNTGTTITQSGPFTAAAGGVVMFRNSTEQAASILPQGTISSLISTTAMFVSNGTTWNALGLSGLVPIIPTSVAGTGVALSANGRITLTAAALASINGCFTSAYDNYLIIYDVAASAGGTLSWRLRLAGTDNTAAVYSDEQVNGTASSVSAGPNPSVTSARVSPSAGIQTTGELRMYAPALATATRHRADWVAGLTATTFQGGMTFGNHTAATAFDGITFIPGTGTLTGVITILGYALGV